MNCLFSKSNKTIVKTKIKFQKFFHFSLQKLETSILLFRLDIETLVFCHTYRYLAGVRFYLSAQSNQTEKLKLLFKNFFNVTVLKVI